jgi:hypothetical protein
MAASQWRPCYQKVGFAKLSKRYTDFRKIAEKKFLTWCGRLDDLTHPTTDACGRAGYEVRGNSFEKLSFGFDAAMDLLDRYV